MRSSAWYATVILFSFGAGLCPAAARTCPQGARDILTAFDTWHEVVEAAVVEDTPLSALQDFQAEGERLGRELVDLDTGNRLLGRYRDILAEIGRDHGADAESRSFENIFAAIRRAGNSLSSASECLALVPVHVPDHFRFSLAGALATVRYIDAEMMQATNEIDAALRSDAPFTDPEGQAFFGALGKVGRFVDTSGGIYTECRNFIAGAQTVGLGGLSPEWAMKTVADAKNACYATLGMD